MKKLCLIAILCFFCFIVKAQTVIRDGNGKPLTSNKYADVTGSPYFSDNWIKGSITMASGDVYKNVDLKYDEITNELIFKSSTGEPMVYLDPVRGFSVETNPPVQFKNGYAENPKQFYQVLTDGKVQLLKLDKKEIYESRQYNSAITNRSITENISYYIFKDGKLTKIKKDQKAVTGILNDKATELAAYAKSNNLDLKSDVDMAKLISYYNTL